MGKVTIKDKEYTLTEAEEAQVILIKELIKQFKRLADKQNGR